MEHKLDNIVLQLNSSNISRVKTLTKITEGMRYYKQFGNEQCSSMVWGPVDQKGQVEGVCVQDVVFLETSMFWGPVGQKGQTEQGDPG